MSPEPGAENPLATAVRAARWIRSAAVDDERGRHWRANPDPRGRAAMPDHPLSLYSGAAGIVLFFLELAAATGDESYLVDARAGARYLAATWREQADLSLHHGLAGVMFVLAEAGWATGDDSFEIEAGAVADQIVRSARPIDGGLGWTGDPAQRGDGGIILGLLHAGGILGVPAYQEIAVEAGARIATLVVPGHRFGEGACADLPLDAVTPGFLSGTAGTAFLLARLYGVTGESHFLSAARRGADFVRAVSTVTERCAMIPHHIPQGRDLHYLGFCSGSAGVARMFYELHRVAGDAADFDWVERLARGIAVSGVPARQTNGYWNAACQCCGAAGLLELFVGLWAATGSQTHLELAQALGANLIGRAAGHDEQGSRWYQAYRRLRPWEVTADTGYMVGAAGIGAALLHLDATTRPAEARRLILPPDNPFPAIPVPSATLRRS
ncbi:lanthionine synthetase LanC family protein [Streptosporangium sp. 'caverna']|uniref:lanthionine synthetase LanC family protein n=1 Tax=Streptosporangium sp. 'caverna' TaxID=2202249 RepID=UPI000D7E494C|nr:lanthionine synthetase LanC family protein [Streptosporangium sp. 'caverna']AWS42917.1 lantibiotic modifying-like protein [Streptosporangium sp. 'caverna']